jgi:hypothetical protein
VETLADRADHAGADPGLVGPDPSPQPRDRHRAISGLMVAGLDPRNDPTGETVAWITKLMPPLTVITPNGWHWYMKDVGLPTIPRLLPGLDLKGSRGYVLAPPSVHPSGKPYERLSDRVIPMPDALWQLAAGRLAKATQRTTVTRPLEPVHTLALADVLGLLQGVRPHRSGYLACCPAHDDAHPSLSVGESATSRLLAKCFAGCAFPAIMRELGRGIGIDSSRRWSDSGGRARLRPMPEVRQRLALGSGETIRSAPHRPEARSGG